MPIEHPLFPLNTVLYPGGPLPLRIFEARYLDMISECMRNERPFGVCLIKDGMEAGTAAQTVDIGTLASIVDWNQLEGGLLGITARGGARFKIINRRVQSNQLVVAELETLPDEQNHPITEKHRSLADLLKEFVEHVGVLYAGIAPSFDDASWVGYRLAELLPIPLVRKQYFLELEDPLARLDQLAAIVDSISQSK